MYACSIMKLKWRNSYVRCFLLFFIPLWFFSSLQVFHKKVALVLDLKNVIEQENSEA